MTKNNLQALINSAEDGIERNLGNPVLCSPEWLRLIIGALEELKAYKWTPCSERLPERNEDVIVYKPGNEDEGTFEEYDIACVWEQEKYDDSGDREVMWCGKEFKYPLEEVTQWMHIPILTKGELS